MDEKATDGLDMKHTLRFEVGACLICNVLAFAATSSAQQKRVDVPYQGGFGGEFGVQSCGVSNPSPSPCAPIPRSVLSASPTYTEQARKAKIEGSCIVGLVVDEKGNPTNLRVIEGLGMGLDEKAIEAVKKWKFEPALKDGKPVPAKISVEVVFHL